MMANCRTENKRVYPCQALYEVSETFGKGKGIQHLVYTNVETHEFSREFYVAKSGDYKSKGVVFNFCPFCGEKLHSENYKPNVEVNHER